MSALDSKSGRSEVIAYIERCLAAGIPEHGIDSFVDGLPLTLMVDEAAPILSVGRDAIYAGIKAGKFPHHRIGDRPVRISREAIRAMLKGVQAQDYHAMMLRLMEEARRREAGLPVLRVA